MGHGSGCLPCARHGVASAGRQSCFLTPMYPPVAHRYQLASLNMAHGAVKVLSALSSGALVDDGEKTLVMDGVGVGFLQKHCYFEKDYEQGNESPFDDRDLTHMQQGSEFQNRVMIPQKNHRQILSRLVKASNLKASSSLKSHRVSKKECDGLLEWARKSLPCLLPYLEVSLFAFALILCSYYGDDNRD